MEHTKSIYHSKGLIGLRTKGEITKESSFPRAKQARIKAKELNNLQVKEVNYSMASVVEYNSDLGFVQITHVGLVTEYEMIKRTIRSLKVAKANNTNLFLIDNSNFEGGTPLEALFELPKLYKKHGFDRSSKGALILPPVGSAAAQDTLFYESICQNRGWQIKVFLDYQDAIAWLTN